MLSSPANPLPRFPLRFLFVVLLGLFSITGTSLFVLWTLVRRDVGWDHPLSGTTTTTRSLGLSPSQLLAVDQRRTIIFQDHPEFQNLGHEFDRFWEDTLPPNLGFLLLFDEAEDRDVWVGVSMFHQLHCLGMIRGAFQSAMQELGDLRAGEYKNESHHDHARLPKRKDVHGDHHDEAHFLHCFDYLRQSFTCLADDTIELPTKGPSGKVGVDGSGPRQCRSASELWELALQSGTWE